MARMMRPMARKLVDLLGTYATSDGSYRLPPEVTPERLLALALEIGGDDLMFFDAAEMLVWQVARHEGYVIPDYPLAGNGEAKKFLAEYGVDDVPSWYERRGVPRAKSSQFWLYSAFMARDVVFWRRVDVFPASHLDSANLLAADVRAELLFCLSSATGDDDTRLFSV